MPTPRKTLRLPCLAALALCTITVAPLHAADEVVTDTAFGSSGELNVDNLYPQGIAMQPDGQVLLAGEDFNGPFIRRYGSTGALDPTFGVNGTATVNPGAWLQYSRIVLLDDGSMLIGGDNNQGQAGVARLLADGTLDTTFGVDGAYVADMVGEEQIDDLDVLVDGRILLTLQSDATAFGAVLLCLEPEGALDFTFGVGGRVDVVSNSSSYAMDVGFTVVRDDGVILVAGERGDFGVGYTVWVKAYGANGSPWIDYGTASEAQFAMPANHRFGLDGACARPDGSIVIAGTQYDLWLTVYDEQLVGFDSMGAPLGDAGVLASIGDILPRGLIQRDDGNLIVYGAWDQSVSYFSGMRMYSSNGEPVEDFGDDGYILMDLRGDQVAAIDGRFVTLGRDQFSSGSPYKLHVGDLHLASFPADGEGLAGTLGQPRMTAFGTGQAEDALAYRVTGAAPSVPAFLVLGLDTLNVPFKSGTLVPVPSLLASLQTTVDGEIAFGLPMPADMPSGFAFWMQTWFADASGPVGFTATNGLKTVAP